MKKFIEPILESPDEYGPDRAEGQKVYALFHNVTSLAGVFSSVENALKAIRDSPICLPSDGMYYIKEFTVDPYRTIGGTLVHLTPCGHGLGGGDGNSNKGK